MQIEARLEILRYLDFVVKKVRGISETKCKLKTLRKIVDTFECVRVSSRRYGATIRPGVGLAQCNVFILFLIFPRFIDFSLSE